MEDENADDSASTSGEPTTSSPAPKSPAELYPLATPEEHREYARTADADWHIMMPLTPQQREMFEAMRRWHAKAREPK